MKKSKRRNVPPAKFDTFLGPDTNINGNLESKGSIRIEGTIKGDVNVTGDLLIGEKANITGNVFANDVYISGTLEGNVYAKGMLKAFCSAKLYGDIEVKSFVTDEGAQIHGKCNMIENTAEKKDYDELLQS